ncbi:hypothetical protein BXZ70DRAFT_909329 [Cristinia sonorae]|uniref:F-box domain-containing protein n=1 Tax=Cristinia sonorae TaxID=1940300 RepID=A0A8K0XM93_9AGAR|nr:hypothetical protein BXZ70DRAFT_909329 [Cristinia sonorae]
MDGPSQRGRKQQDDDESQLVKPTKRRDSRKRSRVTLELLLMQSMDIIFLTLGYLCPWDLIALTRVSKEMCQFLVSKSAAWIWIASRTQFDCIPDCPPNVVEHRWAELLFGGTKCEFCGNHPILNVNFLFNYRACHKCLKSRIVRASEVSNIHPEGKQKILELLPYSVSRSGHVGENEKTVTRYYWAEDVDKMAKKISRLEQAVRDREIHAVKILEAFRTERKEWVTGTMTRAVKLKGWRDAEERVYRTIRGQRRIELKEKFCAENTDWLEVDIDRALGMFKLDPKRPLSDEYWKQIRPLFIRYLKESKASRIEEEESRLLAPRMPLVEKFYRPFLKAKSYRELLCYPTLSQIVKMEPLRSLVLQDHHVTVEEKEIEAVVDQFPSMVQGFKNQFRQVLISQLPDDVSVDSVIAVFYCTACDSEFFPLFGYFEADAHHHSEIRSKTVGSHVKVHEHGRLSAAAILRTLLPSMGHDFIANVDPTRLDALDARFSCTLCSADGTDGRKIMTWRQCVIHYTKAHVIIQSTDGDVPQEQPYPEWKRLSVRDEHACQYAAPDKDRDSRYSWHCNRCTNDAISSNSWRSSLWRRSCLADLLIHIKEVHGIEESVRENQDYFYSPYVRNVFRSYLCKQR